MLDTSMSKIHFLFTMLNINMLLVVKKGVIKGMITKLDFIKNRKENTITSTLDEKLKKKTEHLLKMEERAIEMSRVFLKNRTKYSVLSKI